MMISRRTFFASCAGAAIAAENLETRDVVLLKVPGGGLQPQAAVDPKGIIHLIYLYGDPAAADIGYVRKMPGEKNFSSPIRVNSRPGSAIALGTVRGAHLALGRLGRIHVAWNGSAKAQPKAAHNSAPMLYTRMRDDGQAFENQCNVMQVATGLDGGGTVAADQFGNIYVAWHAQGQKNGQPQEGEIHRRVWLARSSNDGGTFEPETPVSPQTSGACGCCGMGALADKEGTVYLSYRTAREAVHRDMYLLVSRDRGKNFQAVELQPWQIGACPMSTTSLSKANGRVVVSWETERQVYFAFVDRTRGLVGKPVAAPDRGLNRKHPAVAIDGGKVFLAWTEGTGWKKGGTSEWCIFKDGIPQLSGANRQASVPVPAWGLVTAVASKGQFFVIS
ncbi:MAG: sialidase family protein [Bryobacteraceae bacterium]